MARRAYFVVLAGFFAMVLGAVAEPPGRYQRVFGSASYLIGGPISQPGEYVV